jgi:glutaredoxin
MSLQPFRSRAAVLELITRLKGPVLVAFVSEASAASARARPALEAFCAGRGELFSLVVDVDDVPDLHPLFEVTELPTVLLIARGQVRQRVVGVHPVEGYELLLGPAIKEAGPRRVTVFVDPACVWCARIKSYLHGHRVPFTEIDVSKDPRALQQLVLRSGQKGVPQVDVDGRIFVGCDREGLAQALGLPEPA